MLTSLLLIKPFFRLYLDFDVDLFGVNYPFAFIEVLDFLSGEFAAKKSQRRNSFEAKY